MKLPLDDEGNQGEAQPNNHSEERNDSTNNSDNIVQANGSSPSNGTSTASTAEPDFSEYLWMEHEEEFDEQVLKELEDEEMINYYFELYEASMEEEEARKRNGHVSGHHSSQNGLPGRGGPSNFPPGCSVGIPGPASHAGPRPTYRNRDEIDQITRGIDRVSFASRLNPNAAEFVPRGQSVNVSPNADNDSRPQPDTQPC